MIYSLLGAYVFMEVEGPAERKRRAGLLRERLYLGDLLWNLTLNYDGDPQSYNNWTQYVKEQLPRYEERIYQAYKYSMSSDAEVWDFYGALLYCGTIYTTIGYGHVSPSTDWGRIATMIYGAIGVPLALIVLADMGRHFTVLLKVLWVLARKSCDVGACICRVSASAAATAGGAVVSAGRRKISRDRKPPYKITDRFENEDGSAPIAQWEDSRTPVSENTEEDEFDDQDGGMFGSGFLRISGKTPTLADIDDQFNLPMGIAAIILVVYIFLGTLMFKSWEEWGYLEAFYFVFISLSTIGLGDIVPAHSKFFLLSSIYIFFGLSLVSMCINVAIQFFSRTIKKARRTMNEISDRAQRTATMTIGKAKTAVVKIAGDTDGTVSHDHQNGVASDHKGVASDPKVDTKDSSGETGKSAKPPSQGFFHRKSSTEKSPTKTTDQDTVVTVIQPDSCPEGFTG
ncbi:family of potassium channels 18-like isoform X2 [Octopus vulgaris]|uniref:Family of potassium channels 18-like isoform X2 n=3 Tax=Octopus TaxID=6643 RepID=A0AA36FBC3_OCTVU|nr:family of potassium channels 18-like isoform X2 [Octopus vulgaris]